MIGKAFKALRTYGDAKAASKGPEALGRRVLRRKIIRSFVQRLKRWV